MYKRQATGRLRTSSKVPLAPSHRRLQDSMLKNQNDPRTMSLRSINLKIGRLSGNKCAIFEPRTATGRLRTSNKVPFALPHRPLQDSMVKNQNDPRTMSPVSYTHLDVYKRQLQDSMVKNQNRPTDYEPAIKNPQNWSIILLKMRYF